MSRGDEHFFPQGVIGPDGKEIRREGGATIREVVAATVLSGLLANPKGFGGDSSEIEHSVKVADLLIARLTIRYETDAR